MPTPVVASVGRVGWRLSRDAVPLVNSLQNATAVVGIGATPYYRRGTSAPRTLMELAGLAVLSAVEDAGLQVDDIDGFAHYAGGIDTSALALKLGVPEVRYTATLGGGGGGSAGALGLAAAAIHAGMAHTVVCVMALQQSGYRLGRTDGAGSPYAVGGSADDDWQIPFGMVSPSHVFAMIARRHMHLFGTTREHFAEVVISTRNNAARRPSALMRDELTVAQYFKAPMLADPLCLYDYCLENDGAVALIITSAERAMDLAQPPAYILGVASGGEGRKSPPPAWACTDDDYFTTAFHRIIAKRLYEMADVEPGDIDVAELYDHFSPMVLLQLEDYGFCGTGESGPFVAAGNIRWESGSLPVNTHGGNLSESYIMGMTHLKEAVEQIRGTAVNQVANVELALATGGPAWIPTSAVIFRR